jgi:hypothetical protein
VKLDTYSKSKYASVVGQAGGWGWLQELLRTLSRVAAKHGVSVADVASKWVLDRPTVSGGKAVRRLGVRKQGGHALDAVHDIGWGQASLGQASEGLLANP